MTGFFNLNLFLRSLFFWLFVWLNKALIIFEQYLNGIVSCIIVLFAYFFNCLKLTA
jgi:hypothetical protein